MIARCLAQQRPRRVLLLTADPGGPVVAASAKPFTLVTVAADGARLPASVDCRSSDLAFQPNVFDLVIAHGIFSDGSEPELAELERVLGGGGQLLALGLGCYRLGRWGLARRATALRPIWPRRLCKRLRQRSFEIEECIGIGLAGKPASTGHGWRKPLVSFSDLVMVRARRRDVKPIVTPLRFNRPQAAGVQSAVMESFNREAMS